MPVSPRERMYATMRKISEWVDFNREQERKLIPPYGYVSIGGADFDYLLRATVGEAYLLVLGRGRTPDEAHAEAVREGDHCVKVWNERTCKGRVCVNGIYELKRWDKAGESEANALHARFMGLLRSR